MLEGGDAPDLAGFPQPALMAEFVRSGDTIDFGAYTNVDQLKALLKLSRLRRIQAHPIKILESIKTILSIQI